jgi:chromosome segregation ATPase
MMDRYWVPSEILFDDDIGKPRDTEVVTFADHEREVVALKEQVKTLSKGLDQDDEMIATLKEQLREANEAYYALGFTHDHLVEQIAQLTRERDEAKLETDAFRSANKSLTLANDVLHERLDTTQSDLTTLRGLVEALPSVTSKIEVYESFVSAENVSSDMTGRAEAESYANLLRYRATLAGKGLA